MDKPRILGVIPARGGSKGVPRKNVRDLCGAPLIAWTIVPALECGYFTDVVVTTDDEEIARVSREWGAQVPFMRPPDLATDSALAVPTIQHAVREMEALTGQPYDIVVMLQPTSPLRTREDLVGALDELIRHPEADSVISVVDVGGSHPTRMKKFLGPDGRSGEMVDYEPSAVENAPRQALEPVFIRSGAIYATRRDVLMNEGSFKGKVGRGWIVDKETAANIDTEVDFLIAEYQCQKLGLKPPSKPKVQ